MPHRAVPLPFLLASTAVAGNHISLAITNIILSLHTCYSKHKQTQLSLPRPPHTHTPFSQHGITKIITKVITLVMKQGGGGERQKGERRPAISYESVCWAPVKTGDSSDPLLRRQDFDMLLDFFLVGKATPPPPSDG